MVNIYRIACNSNSIIKTLLLENILCSHNILADNNTGLANTHKWSRVLEPRVLEARHKVLKVCHNLIHLYSCIVLTLSVAYRVSSVYTRYAGHIYPNLILCKTCNKDCAGNRNLITLLLSLEDSTAKTYSNKLILAELRGRHYIHIILLRLVADCIAQLLSLYATHTKHKGWWLHSAILVTFVTLNTCTEGNIAIACTVNHGLCKDYLTTCLTLNNNTLNLTILNNSVSNKHIEEHLYAGIVHHLPCNGLGLIWVDNCK